MYSSGDCHHRGRGRILDRFRVPFSLGVLEIGGVIHNLLASVVGHRGCRRMMLSYIAACIHDPKEFSMSVFRLTRTANESDFINGSWLLKSLLKMAKLVILNSEVGSSLTKNGFAV